MIRINLLPHREIRRKQQQQQFFVMLGVFIAAGAVVWLVVHTYLNDRLADQQSRNSYLNEEIAKLDKEIEEIKKLKEQTAALLARKKVVETLQGNRAEVVHLMDQLVRQLPDGVFLKGVKQNGNRVVINGYTQSQARVSTLMRNLEASQYLQNPGLVEIKAVALGTARVNEFTMNVDITRAQQEEPARGNKKPDAKPEAKSPAKG